MKRKLMILLACLIVVFSAGLAMACDCGTCPTCMLGGSSDVKAYGSLQATYGQGTGGTDVCESGYTSSNKESFSYEVRGMGALNEVGDCGTLGVVDGKITGTCTTSQTNSQYTVKANTQEQFGSADLSGLAGVAACATGAASAGGTSNVNQTLTQTQGGYCGAGTQTFTGSVNIATNANAY